MEMNMDHMDHTQIRHLDHTDHADKIDHTDHEHMHHAGGIKAADNRAADGKLPNSNEKSDVISRHHANAESPASATIVVKGGYTPSTVQVEAGQPVRLVFDRQEEGDCSSHVVFKQLDVDKALPAYQKTTLDLGTLEPGEYPFVCGMDMLHGLLKVS